MMASRIVEANSLSDITHVASYPPKYPRNPTEQKRQPLTLYIARVPGSRDVILSTLKPQLKNVTATDVASSLYYLHLNTEEDAQILAEDRAINTEDHQDAENNHIVQKPLPRKPLPDSARSSLDLNRHSQIAPVALPNNIASQKIARKALAPDSHIPTQPIVESKDQIQRRPLGPRPFLSEALVGRKPISDTENRPLSSGSPDLDITSLTRAGSTSLDGSGSHISQHNNTSTAPPKTFSITVIRRDPSSGAQWNIGTIFGIEEIEQISKLSQSSELSQSPKPLRSKKSHFDISVHLTAPGYVQFRDPKASSHTGSGQTKTTVPMANVFNTNMLANPEPGFDRRIRMEGLSFWDRSKQHKRAHSEVLNSHVAPGRSGSPLLPENAQLDLKLGDNAEFREFGSKGYVFKSPWGGRCKFSTSSSGRSLRCKHTLPSPVSATTVGDHEASSHSAMLISELRFNLPSSAVFQSLNTPKLANKFGHIRNKLSSDRVEQRPPLPPRPHPGSYAAMYPSDEEALPPLPPRSNANHFSESSDDDEAASPPKSSFLRAPQHSTKPMSEDEDSPLDLSLGQEKAGGGNRGKRVKLGKLILYDDGFKMMDLAVAANMGVWWSVWEAGS